jgi:hypothetical protein
METTTGARLNTEQIAADNAFLDSLEVSLKEWQSELKLIESELIDQALIDAKAAQGKSNRYIALEKRDNDLRNMVKEAESKLGKIEQRYNLGSLRELMNQTLNHIRP